MPSQLDVLPIINPQECPGYPMGWIQNQPENELNFYINKTEAPHIPVGKWERIKSWLTCTTQKQNQIASDVLACSLIVSSTDNSFELKRGGSNHKDLHIKTANIDKSKPVIIICHGYMSWRNQMLLSNLAARLSEKLSCHTLRFDFSGCGHSTGPWKYANYNQDYDDLCRVVRFVEGDREQGIGLGCKVWCVIGHSQASIAMMRLRQDSSGFGNRMFVNLSGRFTIPGDVRPELIYSDKECEQLQNDGEFQVVRSAESGERTVTITLEAVEGRNEFDISTIAASATGLEHIRTLTIHGDADNLVPVENAYKFHDVIPNHSLHIVKGADHNYNGLKYMNELVSVTASFLLNHAATKPA